MDSEKRNPNDPGASGWLETLLQPVFGPLHDLLKAMRAEQSKALAGLPAAICAALEPRALQHYRRELMPLKEELLGLRLAMDGRRRKRSEKEWDLAIENAAACADNPRTAKSIAVELGLSQVAVLPTLRRLVKSRDVHSKKEGSLIVYNARWPMEKHLLRTLDERGEPMTLDELYATTNLVDREPITPPGFKKMEPPPPFEQASDGEFSCAVRDCLVAAGERNGVPLYRPSTADLYE